MISFFPSRPVALELFGFAIHWYGLMYLLAFLLALFLLPRLQKERGLHLSREDWASVVSVTVLGVIIGGRLGYVLFYEPAYYSIRPLQILMVWKGGMSSHGGFLGVAIGLFYFSWRKGLDVRRLADVIAVPVAIGLAFGRFGNFINMELYGNPTDLPWGIAIPGVEGLRHPTQIYAVLKDLLIAGLCYGHLRAARPYHPGRTFALFLMLYGLLRFLLEYFRAQEYPLIDFVFFQLSRGQLLTLPIFLAGVLLWRWMGMGPASDKS
ncbi:prolipoprotein diacylglyceryl transferase [Candidatus Peregrinibacteria bacterium]|nr:prolipoprotein diacylglyceryl transferase [Candidatus Peregrinibacteria bacterium]